MDSKQIISSARACLEAIRKEGAWKDIYINCISLFELKNDTLSLKLNDKFLPSVDFLRDFGITGRSVESVLMVAEETLETKIKELYRELRLEETEAKAKEIYRKALTYAEVRGNLRDALEVIEAEPGAPRYIGK